MLIHCFSDPNNHNQIFNSPLTTLNFAFLRTDHKFIKINPPKPPKRFTREPQEKCKVLLFDLIK